MSRRRGTYVAIDDKMPEHPRVAGLSDAGFRLFVSLLCYCSRYLTDGHVSTAIAAREAHPKVIRELLEAGLLVDHPTGGYWFPDYLKWNRSRAQVTAKQDAARAANRVRWGTEPESEQ